MALSACCCRAFVIASVLMCAFLHRTVCGLLCLQHCNFKQERLMAPHSPETASEQSLQLDTAHRYISRYAGCWLQSCFQPIFYRSGGVFGHEALLRVHDGDGRAIRPDVFLASLAPAQQLEADALARLLHLRNYAASGEGGCLSLNMLPLTVMHEAGNAAHYPQLLQRLEALGIDSGRVVLEVVEYEVEEGEGALSQALRGASSAGFGIAVDDFGAMPSAHGRVRALCPDIIKIDRSLLLDYMHGDNGRLTAVLRLGWEVGSRMLVEGIETAEQYHAMAELGVELYQGFYMGRPDFLPVCREV